MKLKWLLFPLCLLFVLASCKKDNKQQQPQQQNNSSNNNNTTVLTLANVLQSNMVVQRSKPFLVWGFSPKNTTVTVTASWSNQPITVKPQQNGAWNVTFPASAENSTPQTLTVTDGTTVIKLNNILIGDVWVCAGQSNMVFQVDSIPPFRGVVNYPSEIALANYPTIRTLTLQSDYEINPIDSIKPAKWQVCSPSTVGDVSGVAYYFAQKLNNALNVPIGIIVSAVDGTSCEAWISADGFRNNAVIANYNGLNNSTQLYNGMISPLTSLAISGFIWYQGENNRGNNPPDYTALNSTLINDWRSHFSQGQLPFYLVQMPPFAVDYFQTVPYGGNTVVDDYAKFREAQANVLAVPGTGMAVTMDVGEPANQHPRNKKAVGERLALLALKNNYGQNVQCYGPHFSSYTVNGSTVTVNFASGTASGLNTIGNAAINQYFLVAGTDRNFYPATATIQGSQVMLAIPSAVNLPVQAIRYAFTNAPVTNLQNSAGLPAEPFRTDNWSN